MVRYHRSFDRYRTDTGRPRESAPLATTYYGPSGIGKTHTARALARDLSLDFTGNPDSIYVKPESSKWWDGYEQQLVVIVDEMNGNRFTYSLLKQLVNNLPLLVEVKGGYVQFNSPFIIFTTNVHPSNWYQADDFVQGTPLYRRLVLEGDYHDLSHLQPQWWATSGWWDPHHPSMRKLAFPPPMTVLLGTIQPTKKRKVKIILEK